MFKLSLQGTSEPRVLIFATQSNPEFLTGPPLTATTKNPQGSETTSPGVSSGPLLKHTHRPLRVLWQMLPLYHGARPAAAAAQPKPE